MTVTQIAHNQNQAHHELQARAGELLNSPPMVERLSYLVGAGHGESA